MDIKRGSLTGRPSPNLFALIMGSFATALIILSYWSRTIYVLDLILGHQDTSGASHPIVCGVEGKSVSVVVHMKRSMFEKMGRIVPR